MEKKLIEMSKQYTTRNGKAVRVLCVDSKNGEYKVVALVGDNEIPENYTEYGQYFKDGRLHDLDLKEKPVERKLYLEVFSFLSWSGDCSYMIHDTIQGLKESISNNEEGYVLVATKEITFTEGEFI